MLFPIEQIEKTLPEELRIKFRSDNVMAAKAIVAINRFSEWFQHSNAPFFRNYTNHSEKHSLDVFSSSIEFMHEDAFDIISAYDLSVLICACFCHDAGMHLTETQFIQLISEENTVLFTNLDSKSWSEEWSDFIHEARRFNEDTLVAIFGDNKPVPEIPDCEFDFTDRHRLLIGEFIRRKHPRLAHDIANGLDTKLGLPSLLEGFDERMRDIIGLIARSHGEDLRYRFSYLENEYNLRDYNGIHVVYLMGLIRLADYAQIQASRAPILKAAIHRIRSPVSQREWRVHQSIINITRTHDDPEAIFVDSRPTCVSDFLRVKSWLVDLQLELDKTWATLGELYGRQSLTGLDRLQLSIRRIRSKIIEGFATEQFVPESIAFRVAETEMLSLLLAPLYGDHPGYGVRELLQNARDAVLEAQAADAPHLVAEQAHVSVVLEKQEGGAKVSVIDNGAGMTVDILKNYFLNAGVSYRSSKVWQSDNLDNHGKSRVARSGRFGVGALAAFLIGRVIKLTTRHWKSNRGITFEAALHDKEINVSYVDCAVGTLIEIDCDKKTEESLKSYFRDANNYYEFDESVKVTFQIKGYGTADKMVSANRSEAAKAIDTFSTEQYPAVTWGMSENITKNYVNGIAIAAIERSEKPRTRNPIYQKRSLFEMPAFAKRYHNSNDFFARKRDVWVDIRDGNALAPINLARDKFLAFDSDISDAIDTTIFRSAVRFIDSKADEVSKLRYFSSNSDKDCLLSFDRSSFLFRGKIAFPNDVDLYKHYGVNSVFCVPVPHDNAELLNDKFPDSHFMPINHRGYTASDLVYLLRKPTVKAVLR
ncbi:ATP-binding protein [Rhizobium sp. Rhizsp82]|uniref:HD domain-containing protein n=1 Tax=Rhizobium sp. Rhizsp82 TaxID=3243057 RepID=UPI0039B47DF8